MYNTTQTTSYGVPRALNYNDIVLRHNKGILSSRADAKISVDFGEKILTTPVILANVAYIQRYEEGLDILHQLDQRKYGYIYHRLDGNDDIIAFVERTNKENWHLISISIGIKDADKDLIRILKDRKLRIDWLTVDIAFAYTESALNFIKWARQEFPDTFLIAGNFSEAVAAIELADLGVDCVKLNLGVSSACRTRQFTGFGSMTISSLQEVSESLMMRYHTPPYCPMPKILQDGGLTITDGEVATGDVFKALNFGADAILSASIFGRVKELADKDGNVLTYGNSTARAKGHHTNVEGSEFEVKAWDRTLEQQCQLIEDSLRSSCSYAGISDVKDAYNSCEYYIVN